MKRFRKILCCILCAAILAAGLSWRAYAEESGDGETGSIATPKAAVLLEELEQPARVSTPAAAMTLMREIKVLRFIICISFR